MNQSTSKEQGLGVVLPLRGPRMGTLPGKNLPKWKLQILSLARPSEIEQNCPKSTFKLLRTQSIEIGYK